MKRTDYYVKYGMDVLSINDRVDKIFDDVESRTCENCKYYRGDILICMNHVEINGTIYHDFGCNDFEQKEKL